MGSQTLRQWTGFHCHQLCPGSQRSAPRIARPACTPLQVEARQLDKRERIKKRHQVIRKKVEGKPERPRLAVYRSNNNIYVQVINDAARHTLVAASTNMPGLRDELNGNGSNVAAAVLVGKKIAELCKAANIEKVCFDRGGNIYHGRVKAVADAAREAGLVF